MTGNWLASFGSEPAPFWLQQFSKEPQSAISAMLTGAAYLGPSNVADPKDVLIDWLLMLEDREDFTREVDDALSAWATTQWGHTANDLSGNSSRLAICWVRLFDVVSAIEGLTVTATTLRGFFEDRYEYLGALASGPSRDPLGRYLLAIARHQRSRELAPTWWQICDLAGQTPFYHGLYGIAGVRGMPAEASQAGGFRDDVAAAVLRLGAALVRLCEQGVLPESRATDEFLGVARATMRAYPFPGSWKDTLHTLDHRSAPLLGKWVEGLLLSIPSKTRSNPQRAGGKRPAIRHTDWKSRADDFVARLKTVVVPVSEIEPLLQEQRNYAERTGDTYGFVAALTRLGRAMFPYDPGLAIDWLFEAKRWEPNNSYPWHGLVRALRMAGRNAEAAEIACEALERFPHVTQVWTEVLAALRATHPLLAEEVAREALSRFPEDKYFHHGLIRVLAESGQTQEAIERAREAVTKFPDDGYSWTILGELLRLVNEFPEAEQVYKEGMKRFPDDVRWWMDVAIVLRHQQKPDEAERILREGLSRFKNDEHLANSLATLLRSSGRLEEARILLADVIERTNSTVSKITLASVLRRLGKDHYQEAMRLIEESLAKERSSDALTEKSNLLELIGDLDGSLRAAEEASKVATAEVADLSVRAEVHLSGIKTGDDFEVDAVGGGLEEARRQVQSDAVKPRAGKAAANAARPDRPDRPRQIATPSPRLTRRAIIALAGRARLLRRLAHRYQRVGQTRRATELRSSATSILDTILISVPSDARALTEKALLLIESDQLEAAERIVREATKVFPGSHTLRTALARARRMAAIREQRRFAPAAYDHLVTPLLAMEQASPIFAPVARLGEGRASLALTDGKVAEDLALRAFGRLKDSLTETSSTTDSFRHSWAVRVGGLVFAGELRQVNSVGLSDVRESVSTNSFHLDEMEEEFGNWAFAQQV